MVRYEPPIAEEQTAGQEPQKDTQDDSQRQFGPPKWYPGSYLVKFRTEEIYECNKEYGKITVVHRYEQAASVFGQWKADTPFTMKKCLDHDYRYWKGLRFIKDKEDYAAVQKVLRKHFFALKALHLCLVSRSGDFPATAAFDFSQFARKARFLDKNLNQATIDRLFIATNVELEN